MHDYAAVICVGQDLLLLSLRCQVVATRFAVVCPATPQTLAPTLAENPFDLMLLCHSLSCEESDAAISLFRRQNNRAVIVSLHPDFECLNTSHLDAVVSTLGGPLALFRAIEGVMRNGAPRFGLLKNVPPVRGGRPDSYGIQPLRSNSNGQVQYLG